MKSILFIILFLMCSKFYGQNFGKFKTEHGTLMTQTTHFLSPDTIHQVIYFSCYGATEYVELTGLERPGQFSCLMIDSTEFDMVSDSFSIKTFRSHSLYQNCVMDTSSKLYSSNFSYHKLKDTLYLNIICEFFSFHFESTGTSGVGIFWKNIPLLLMSDTEGMKESFRVIRIDTMSVIPEERMHLPVYMKY